MGILGLGLLLHTKFHLDRCMLLYITKPNHANFTKFSIIGATPDPSSWPIIAKFWRARIDTNYKLSKYHMSYAPIDVFLLTSLQLIEFL